jgi:hypothetical protein
VSIRALEISVISTPCALDCGHVLPHPRLSEGRELIVDTWRHVRVHAARDEAVTLELARRLGQHLVTDLAYASLQVENCLAIWALIPGIAWSAGISAPSLLGALAVFC